MLSRHEHTKVGPAAGTGALPGGGRGLLRGRPRGPPPLTRPSSPPLTWASSCPAATAEGGPPPPPPPPGAPGFPWAPPPPPPPPPPGGVWVWLGKVKSVNSNSEPCVSAPSSSASSVSRKVSVCELGPYASTLMMAAASGSLRRPVPGSSPLTETPRRGRPRRRQRRRLGRARPLRLRGLRGGTDWVQPPTSRAVTNQVLPPPSASSQPIKRRPDVDQGGARTLRAHA